MQNTMQQTQQSYGNAILLMTLLTQIVQLKHANDAAKDLKIEHRWKSVIAYSILQQVQGLLGKILQLCTTHELVALIMPAAENIACDTLPLGFPQ